MKQTQKNTYVERELRRRRIEARYRFFKKLKDGIAGFLMMAFFVAVMYAFVLITI